MTRHLACVLLALVLGILLCCPSRSGAQYMYLDANGDGIHTDADALDPAAPTTLDVWIVTDRNRDGTLATCSSGDGDLTINAYEFILHASNGTVAWGSVTNQVTGFILSAGAASNASDLHFGATGSSRSPGLYRLASVVVSPASGTPRIDIVAQTPLGATYTTSFASQCSGVDYSNTLTLGTDWLDVDGVRYGGVSNRAPVFVPVPDLVVTEGATLEQSLSASDPDGDPLQFAKESGPSFLTVTTLDSGTGTASGLVRLTPGYSDAGAVDASVTVTDGFETARARFRVTVLNQNRGPTLEQPADVQIQAETSVTRDLHASDPDGGPLEFLLVSGPAFVTVTTVEPISPARGIARIEPSRWDVVNTTATVAVTDGTLQDERTFAIRVTPSVAPPPLLCRPYDMTVVAGTTAEQELMATDPDGVALTFRLLEGPPFVTVTTDGGQGAPQTGRLYAAPSSADLGVHTVTLEAVGAYETVYESFAISVVSQLPPREPRPELFTSTFRSYDVGDIPQGVVIADVDRDGRPDVLTANYGCGISVLLGVGAGQLMDRRDIHTEGNPKALSVADLDQDGDLDVVVANGFGDAIGILLGDGTGAFTEHGYLPAGPDAAYAAIADLNRDGILDLVGADEAGNSISIYLGRGGAAFGARRVYSAGRAPCYTAVKDFNGDGVPDVAAANEGSDGVTVHLGVGDGTFLPATLVPTADGPSSVVTGDFDSDGNTDLAASGFHSYQLSVVFGDGQGSFSRRLDLETGAYPWSMAAVDLNGDGRLDLVSANTGDITVGVHLGRGDGTFGPVTTAPAGFVPRYVAGGDLSGDGFADLVVANELAGTISVLLGHGDGTFGSTDHIAMEVTPNAVAHGDITGDHVDDLVATVALETREIRIYPGLGGGQFGLMIRIPLEYEPLGSVLADVNRDGVLDLLVPQYTGWALFAGGPGLATTPPSLISTGGSPSGITTGDWNGDGKPDVAVSYYGEARVSIFEGDGAGGFAGPRDIPTPTNAVSIGSGDWDGDGISDLAVGVGGQGGLVFWGSPEGPVPGPQLPELEAMRGYSSGDLDGNGRSEMIAIVNLTEGGIGIFRKARRGLIVIYQWAERDAPPSRRAYPGGSLPVYVSAADLTGDGRLDLVVAEEGAGAVGIFPSLADGTLGRREDYGTGSYPRSLDIWDIDADGDRDILTIFGPFARANFRGIGILRNLGGAGPPPPLAARAFFAPGDRTWRVQSGKPALCVHLEPVGGSFAIDEVDPASIRMSRAGSEADPIAPIAARPFTVSDSDRNGISEITACFARDDLRRLFADLRGSSTATVILTGTLDGGRVFRAEQTLAVVGPARGLAARMTPNPLNPAAVLTFTLSRPGPVRVTVYDVRGRTVARLMDSKRELAGEHRLHVGEGDSRAPRLASGIYFYRIETKEESASGRFVVVK